MSFRILFLIITSITILNSCRKDVFDLTKREIGMYYINQTNKYSFLYHVEEIIYNDFFNTIDTLNYQILEVNDTFFNDNLNLPILRIEKYKRNNDSSKWVFLETVGSRLSNYKYERIENNTKKIKLSFPITFETIWNTNTFNSNNNLLVYYNEINTKKTVNNSTYDSVLVVKSDPISNQSSEKLYEEIYAKNIGLLYSNLVSLDKFNDKIRGYKIKYTLLKHGF